MADRLQALIVTGMTDLHHDWRAVTPLLAATLRDSERFDVRVTEEFRGASGMTLAPYDVVVLNWFGKYDVWGTEPEVRWGEKTERALQEFVQAGGGLVAYHASLQMGRGQETDPRRLFGGRMEVEMSRRAPINDFRVRVAAPDHPVTAGMPAEFPHYEDDLYVNLDWDPEAPREVLLTGWDNPLRYTQVPSQFHALPGMGQDHPVAWTNRFGDGRVFATGLGHGVAAASRPTFQGLFARGAEWAATGTVTIPLPTGFGEPVEGGDWWPTVLEPQARSAYEARWSPAAQQA
jgi:type 1 glutamine amidotransferase